MLTNVYGTAPTTTFSTLHHLSIAQGCPDPPIDLTPPSPHCSTISLGRMARSSNTAFF